MKAHRTLETGDRRRRVRESAPILLALAPALLAVLVAVAVLEVALPSPASAQDGDFTVTVLHTTDLHGHVFPTADYSDEPAAHGLARLATLLAAERERDPEALLVDAGDCIQGAPLALVAHTRLAGEPDPMMAVMNHLGYDAFAVGNHEYDFGWERLEKARAEADFPWLSANTLRGGEPAFEPYRVFTVRGVRIGVLGLTTPAIPNWLDREKYPGLVFHDAVRTAKRWVPVLREREGCHAVVVVTHQGLERDPSTGEARGSGLPGENAAWALAHEVPGIDAIVMGHTHRVVPFARVNGVLLTQAGRWADHLGRLTLRFEASDEGPRLIEARGDVVPVTLETEPDPDVLAIVEPYRDATAAWLDERVGTAEGVFDASGGRFEDDEVLDLIHEAQLRHTGADVSFAALFHTGSRFGPGPIRVRDLAGVYVYENTLYTVEANGAQIRAALEHSARYFRPYEFGRRTEPLVNPAIPGFNFDTAQGVSYEIDLTEPPGRRVKNLRFLGRPLEDDRTLTVALNSYRANGGGGYDMWKDARVLSQTREGMREILIEHVRGRGRAVARADDNWRLVPEFIAHPARDAAERLVRHGVWTSEEVKVLQPDRPLRRADFAAWLGRAYAQVDRPERAPELPFSDVPETMARGVTGALNAGAFARYDEELFRPTETIDLLSAVDWTVHAAEGGRLERLRRQYDARGRPLDRGPTVEIAPPAWLRLERAPERYGENRLPVAVERHALANGFLDEWDPASDPHALTVADGARLLAGALFPVITLLHTSDFHGAFLPKHTDFRSGRPLGSSPILAAYVERERARNPEGTLLLSGGDLMQGTLISNLSFGRAVIEQMNRLGYDAFGIGNHEFDWNADTLASRLAEARFPGLAANMHERGSDRIPAWAGSHATFRRRGLTVGVIGFATVSTPRVTMPAHVEHLEFEDPAPIAERLIRELREREGARVVVLVGHLPGSQDSLWAPVRGELADLARAVEGEDAALGGHSHNFLLGLADETPVLIPGAHGMGVGRIDLVVDRRRGEVVERRAEIVRTFADAIEPDPEIAAFVDSMAAVVGPLADRVLCNAPEPLTRGGSAPESEVGNWVTDVIREAGGAQVGLQNAGGLRANVDAGPVTVQDVYEVMPFDNRIVTLEMTGAQLLEALEHGLRRANRTVQVSGITLVFDPERPSGERVVELRLADGSEVRPEGRYRVATNNFMATGGDGYTMFAEAETESESSVLIRDAMIADCERRGREGRPLSGLIDGRIRRAEAEAGEGVSTRD